MDLVSLFRIEQIPSMPQKEYILNLKELEEWIAPKIKPDGDRAIDNIVENVGKLRGEEGLETIPKLSIPYEHQSNGAAESVNNVSERTRNIYSFEA